MTERKKTMFAGRVLPLEGGYNFRDLGGYATREGRRVKWGMFIRADELGDLTDEDLRYLSSVPIRTVVDFRSENEVACKPDRFPESMTENYFCPIDPGSIMSLVKYDRESITMEQSEEIMVNLTVSLISQKVFQETIRFLFELSVREERIPLLFHCSAGKDRTGLAAALILGALGVDRETIYEDYLLSNACLDGKYAKYIQPAPVLRPLFEVRRRNLEAAFEKIERDEGSLEAFLVSNLKVDLERFKERFLE